MGEARGRGKASVLTEVLHTLPALLIANCFQELTAFRAEGPMFGLRAEAVN